MEERHEPIAVRLRKGLELSGMKQADLARKTGLDRGAVSSYLSGRYEPKQKAIYLMARALNVSEAWLLGYDVPIYRTDGQKKNDQLAELIVKMRTNDTYFNLVAMLADIDDERLDLVAKLVGGFINK